MPLAFCSTSLYYLLFEFNILKITSLGFFYEGKRDHPWDPLSQEQMLSGPTGPEEGNNPHPEAQGLQILPMFPPESNPGGKVGGRVEAGLANHWDIKISIHYNKYLINNKIIF